MQKPKNVRKVTIEEMWQAFVQAGYTPRDAKLQCRWAQILGSEVLVNGEYLTLKES